MNLDKATVARILDREERPAPIQAALQQLAGKNVLITGGGGSIASALAATLHHNGITVLAPDIQLLDVRDATAVAAALRMTDPDVIFHLAGDKHAPHGEEDAAAVADTNITGTRNILSHARGARVVVASTCKACDPETVYGASKLICERLALQAGQSVARFYNVVETQGNVFEMWAEQAKQGRIYVADCARYFISLDEAVALLINTAVLESGRYTVTPGERHKMFDIAKRLHPDAAHVPMKCRRGDRQEEPLLAESEQWDIYPYIEMRRVTSYHDAPVVRHVQVAA